MPPAPPKPPRELLDRILKAVLPLRQMWAALRSRTEMSAEKPHVHVSLRNGVTVRAAEEALNDPAFIKAVEDMAELLRAKESGRLAAVAEKERESSNGAQTPNVRVSDSPGETSN